MPSATAFKYLLDTNIVSALVREPQGQVTRQIARVGESKVCTSIIVACELRFGAATRGSPMLTEQLGQVLSPFRSSRSSPEPITAMASCARSSSGTGCRSVPTTC